MRPERDVPPSIHIFSTPEMLVLVARVRAWRHLHGELCRVLGRDWCVCVRVMYCQVMLLQAPVRIEACIFMCRCEDGAL